MTGRLGSTLPTLRKYKLVFSEASSHLFLMLQYLKSIDAQLFMAINSAHCPYIDNFMWAVSAKYSCVLIALALLYVLYLKGWKQMLVALGAVAIVVLLADQVSSSIIKPMVERLRPSHDPALAGTVHVVNGYVGGQFGFVSSHAANIFGVALLVSLFLRNRWATISLMLWALLVSYSRIYLGVHFPGDILGGIVVGLGAGWLVYALWRWLQGKYDYGGPRRLFNACDAQVVAGSVLCNVLIIAIIAAFG